MNDTSSPVSVVEQILRFNHDRKRAWLKIKYARMAENAFAFFRGTNHLYAARWPRMGPADHGPNLLICGDLHLDNFGAYRSDAGDFRQHPCPRHAGTTRLLGRSRVVLYPVLVVGDGLANAQ
jgi:uncharacterized protein (DUF2252 family)